MTTFDELRSRFCNFYKVVKKGHEDSSSSFHGGHGLDHDVTVAMIATKIALSEEIGQKAWCAAMLHSVDRTVTQEKVEETMFLYAKNLETFFSSDEISEIVEAALRHSELNQPNQNQIQVTLMDADRLANMQLAVAIRGGQFRPSIPVFEFMYLNGKINPLSTYENPKSIIDNLRLVISQYVPQLRLPKAQQLGIVFSKRLQDYINVIEQDYEDLALSGTEL